MHIQVHMQRKMCMPTHATQTLARHMKQSKQRSELAYRIEQLPFAAVTSGPPKMVIDPRRSTPLLNSHHATYRCAKLAIPRAVTKVWQALRLKRIEYWCQCPDNIIFWRSKFKYKQVAQPQHGTLACSGQICSNVLQRLEEGGRGVSMSLVEVLKTKTHCPKDNLSVCC